MDPKNIFRIAFVILFVINVINVRCSEIQRSRRAEDDDDDGQRTMIQAIQEFFNGLFGTNPGPDNPAPLVASETNLDVLDQTSETETSTPSSSSSSSTRTTLSSTTSLTRTTETTSGVSGLPIPDFLEEARCYSDAILQNFCVVPSEMVDVSFWDLYSVLFSDGVLEELMNECLDGDWCLQDRFDYWEALIVERIQMVTQSQIARDMCLPDIAYCLEAIVDQYRNCSVYRQMQFTVEAISLVCGLKSRPSPSQQCYEHVLESFHVTLADILRKELTRKKRQLEDEGACDSPEASMTKGYICVINSCPTAVDLFSSFRPWQWFMPIVSDLIDGCDLDQSSCEALLQVGGASSTFSQSSEGTAWLSSTVEPSSYLVTSSPVSSNILSTTTTSTLSTAGLAVDDSSNHESQVQSPSTLDVRDAQVMLAISFATLVTVLLLTFTVCVCYKRKRRDAVLKDGYQKLLTEGDES